MPQTCSRCNNILQPEVIYCSQCGNKVKSNNTGLNVFVGIGLYTLASAIVTVTFVLLFKALFDFNIVSLGIFFIIPAGAILLGLGITSGMYWGLQKYNKRPSSKYYIVSMLITFLTFVGLHYYDYLNFYYQGVHISNYAINGASIDFFRYMQLVIESNSIQFFYRVPSISLGEPVSSVVFNYIDFTLQVIGVVGAGASLIFLLREKDYCISCNKYYTSTLLTIVHGKQDKFYTESMMEVIEALTKKQRVKSEYGAIENTEQKCEIILRYCNECLNGKIYSKLSRWNENKGEWESQEEKLLINNIDAKVYII